MQSNLFTSSPSVQSSRILYTPSPFARSSLLHLQEVGSLTAIKPHTSKREKLQSYLCFMVEDGEGELVYEGKRYDLKTGDVVFIDCRKAYSHSTGNCHSTGNNNRIDNGQGDSAGVNTCKKLWTLRWCHFYGPNMNAIYRKYQERGGRPAFQTEQLGSYRTILTELYQIAKSDDYVRDMRIHEKLSSLLILLMEDAWCGEKVSKGTPSPVDIQQVKEYLDINFTEKITLDDLASKFYINKYYLLSCFKERYGVTINAYLNQVRVTWVKQQLRFTDKTVETLAAELQIEPAYLSRLFKKVEGVSPTSFRKSWKGR